MGLTDNRVEVEKNIMILTAHQPAYLPWLGLFEKIEKADCFIIMDDVQFEKNSFINRNKIKSPNGEILLTVPLLLKGHIHKTITCMKINNTINWRKKHWMSLYFNYKKTPYFSIFADFFEDMYHKEWSDLSDLLDHQLRFFLDVLKIQTRVLYLKDLRLESKKQELIIDMCNITHSNKFIFGALGGKYMEAKLFEKNNIIPECQNYKHPVYSQMGNNGFISHLSVVDLLFNEGPEKSLEIIMGNKK